MNNLRNNQWQELINKAKDIYGEFSVQDYHNSNKHIMRTILNKNGAIIFDTCSLMNVQALPFFYSLLESANGQKANIYIAEEVIEELDKHSQKTEDIIEKVPQKARLAKDLVKILQDNGHVTVKGGEKSFTDHKIARMVFELFNTKKVFLFTEDTKLAGDVNKLTNTQFDAFSIIHIDIERFDNTDMQNMKMKRVHNVSTIPVHQQRTQMITC